MKPKYSFKAGDLVRHTSAFLRSTGWYTNVPKDGRVEAVDDSDPNFVLLTILWCDREQPIRVNACNVMPVNKPDYS
jgi:hypothetical protein